MYIVRAKKNQRKDAPWYYLAGYDTVNGSHIPVFISQKEFDNGARVQQFVHRTLPPYVYKAPELGWKNVEIIRYV